MYSNTPVTRSQPTGMTGSLCISKETENLRGLQSDLGYMPEKPGLSEKVRDRP
jgi:hypothetical protein